MYVTNSKESEEEDCKKFQLPNFIGKKADSLIVKVQNDKMFVIMNLPNKMVANIWNTQLT